MATPLQITANRRNAQLSTGPRTDEGRDRSRRNALKHGLTAQHILLFDETVEEFEAFYDETVAALKPRDTFETQLVERIALCAWRLRRAYRIETGMFENVRKSWANGTPQIEGRIEQPFIRVTAYDDHLASLSRYETSLERSMLRAAYLLQQRRAGFLGTQRRQ